MIYDPHRELELEDILFPVKVAKAFAATAPDRLTRAPRYKAIVNGSSGRVISIVGRQYQLLLNQDALDLARLACTLAFPNTATEEWEADRVVAAQTGGSCTVDLYHKCLDFRYDWTLAPGITDTFRPFVRFQNGYNGRTPFSIFFGFERLACENAIIVTERIRRLKVPHVKTVSAAEEMAVKIEARIRDADLERVPELFRASLVTLFSVTVPRYLFGSIVRYVLRIRRPKDSSSSGERDWADLVRGLEPVCDRYVDEFGPTGFALLNVLSDCATRPAAANLPGRRGHASLQRLVAVWLHDVSLPRPGAGFDWVEYVRGFPPEYQPVNGGRVNQ